MGGAAGSAEAGTPHVPVLLDSVLAALGPLEGCRVLDGTYGAGGYSRAFLSAGAAQVIGVDRDVTVVQGVEKIGNLTLVEGIFSELDEIAADHADGPMHAIVLDIGVSSMQLDQGERGFSFLRDGPLDMRMSGTGPSAADLVNRADESDLADIFYHFGEDRAARRLARAVVRARADGVIERTLQLAEIIEKTLPKARPGQIHPATRAFQGLRISVNDELGELVRALGAAERTLPEGALLVVVTFHSLEDRIVKRYLQVASATSGGGSRHGPARVMPAPRYDAVPKPVSANADEIARNPRARSARLRVGKRTAAPFVALDPMALGMPQAPLAVDLFGGDAR